MGTATVAGGIQIEVATPADVQKAVDSGTERVIGRLDRFTDRHHGVRRTLAGSTGTNGAAATGKYLVNLGTPEGNRLWWLGEIVVLVDDVWTAPASTVSAVFIGRPPIDTGKMLATDFVPFDQTVLCPAAAVPSRFTFSKEFIPVKQGEYLFVIVNASVTALTNVSVTARVMEVNASAVSMNLIG